MKLFIALILLVIGCDACYLNYYPITFRVADKSTYLAMVKGGTGTAWVVSNGYWMTAGHVCDVADGADIRLVPDDGPVAEIISARPVVMETSFDFKHDLCLLAGLTPVPPLILSKQPAVAGTKVYMVGFPHGMRGTSEGIMLDERSAKMSVQPGFSGAAVTTPEGVVGVLVASRYSDNAAVIIPVQEIRRILDEAGVSYTLTPDPPPEPETVFDWGKE